MGEPVARSFKTIDQHISENYAQVKQDIIDFAMCSSNTLSSKELRALARSSTQRPAVQLPKSEPQISFLRKAA